MDLLRNAIYKMFNFTNNTSLQTLLTTIIMIIIWFIVGIIFGMISKKVLKKLLSHEKRKVKQQTQTLFTMVNKVINSLFWFFIVIMILDELNINFLPVLASAGIVAFAVGFGAQELIKDLISGFFLIIENAFDVGDVIEVGNFKGRVIQVGLRRTRLQNWKNEILVVNNGDIRSLVNFSQNDSVGAVELIVSYQTDLSLFNDPELLKKFTSLKDEFPQIKETPSLIGITSLKDNGMLIRFTFKTETYKHVAPERKLREIIIDFCRDKNIQTANYIINTNN